jgi:hypothetical protein
MIAKALIDLGYNGPVEIRGEEIIYQDESIPHQSLEVVLARAKELQAGYDALAYARSRKVEYDALNQLEMQYDDKVNGTTTWEDAIVAIKAKYPKPE